MSRCWIILSLLTSTVVFLLNPSYPSFSQETRSLHEKPLHGLEEKSISPKTYHFESVTMKELWGADISGDSCDDLVGVIYGRARAANGIWEHLLKLKGKEGLESDRQQRATWRKNKPAYDSHFFCFPYVSDVSAYLRNSDNVQLSGDAIQLKTGPLLLRFQESNVPTTWKLNLLNKRSCSQRGDEFCLRLEFSFKTPHATATTPDEPLPESGNYRLFCWDCDKLVRDSHSLQNALLYMRRPGGLRTEFALSGGYMIPEGYISPQSDNSPPDAKTLKNQRLEYFRSLLTLGRNLDDR